LLSAPNDRFFQHAFLQVDVAANGNRVDFNDTFFNNITMGQEDISREKVIRAAQIANAHDFIMATEQGYDTPIGEGGNKLSGGQKQRISIARALLKKDETLKSVLRNCGMLTRDSRVKERKKPGQPGARKRFQFSKR
jgi:ribosomal protein S9